MIVRCHDCAKLFDSFGDPDFYTILVDENRAVTVCDACLDEREEQDRYELFERSHA